MSDNPDKNTTIAQVYGEFVGSVADTLRDARKKDPSIKLQDVKDWFANNFLRKRTSEATTPTSPTTPTKDTRWTCSSSTI